MQTLQRQLHRRAGRSTRPGARWSSPPSPFGGCSTVRGRFDRFDGSYEAGPDGIAIELTVDGDSLDTGNAKRDDHLRSADFFGIADHRRCASRPPASTTWARGCCIRGGLEAAGAVVPVELDATLREAGGGLDVEATTTVDHAHFGMSSGLLGMIRPPAVLHVKAHLTR